MPVIHENLAVRVPAWRWSLAASSQRRGLQSLCEHVVAEAVVGLMVNGRTLLRFSCLPDRLDDLAVGFLRSEGLIDRAAQVTSVSVGPDDVRVEAEVPFDRFLRFFETVALLSGCGRGGGTTADVPRVTSAARFSPEACLAMMQHLQQASPLFDQTGGVHLAALAAGRQLADCEVADCKVIDVAEDVGRHNAVDKVIGRRVRVAAPAECSFADVMLLTTGRLSREIVSKACRVGLPVVVSRSAPTSVAVELARGADLTLVGFVRGRRLNVYAAPWRLGLMENGR